MKFLADRTLGKLAKRLRMLGYDTLYYSGQDLHQLIHLARDEERVILTRDTKLALKRPNDRIVTLAENIPSRQLQEVVQKNRLSLDDDLLFSRCLFCNKQIVGIPHQDAEGKVPDFVFNQQKEFYRCPQCGKIYWQGSHLVNMRKRVKELIPHARRAPSNH